MPTIYQLKPKFQQLLRTPTRGLHRAGISANAVTIFACLASFAWGAWMALQPGSRWPWLLLPLFLFARMALNAIDGMLAREFNQQSRLGAILNEAGDVVADTCLYAPFALLAGVNSGIVAAVVFLSILSEFIGVLGQVIGGGRRYDGPLGKSDRAFLFGALGLLVGAEVPLLPYLNSLFVLAAALLVWTVVNRTRQALRQASS